MNTAAIVIIVIAAIILIAIIAWAASRRQHSEKLREKYGAEYDYTVNQMGNQRKAEAVLDEREERVNALDIKPLTPAERDRFSNEWQHTQAQFVDEPVNAVKRADQLIQEVMKARNIPVADFEQRAADVSVLYPQVVTNYRTAHDIALRNERGESNTEELRQAMVYYRSLFSELLETGESETNQPKETTA